MPQESHTSTENVAGLEAGVRDEASTGPIVSSSDNGVRFEDLGLSPEVIRAVADSGYVTPTPIQAQGIPEVLKGKDIIGIAQTGTGKTASFVLPMLTILARGRAKARMPRTLILEPTRELAAQVAESFERYGKYHKLSMALLIGGTSYEDQDKKLDRGVDVLIATPGRLLDHFERGKLMLSQVQILVIDEADRMLDMGFIPDVERIAKMIPFTRQTLFYSATMPPEIQRLTDQFLQAPIRVEVSKPATAATTIAQVLVTVPGGDWSKRESLRRLVRDEDVKNAIVFCNRKRDVDVVAKSLVKHGFSAAALHGDLDQPTRTRTLDAFRNGEIRLLVASDVAARGLDIPMVSHIFNFDVPIHADDYVHRIGRTGRAGRAGSAFMLVGRGDEKYVAAIESLIGQTIERRAMEGLPPENEHSEHRRPDSHRHSRGGRNRGRDKPSHTGHARTETPRLESRPNVPVQTVAPPKAIEAAPPPARHEQRAPIEHDQLPAFLLRPVTLPPGAERRPAKGANPRKTSEPTA